MKLHDIVFPEKFLSLLDRGRVKVTETDPFLKLQHKINQICKKIMI
jgi:hypothetical protein